MSEKHNNIKPDKKSSLKNFFLIRQRKSPNKDKNVHRFALRGELLEIEKERSRDKKNRKKEKKGRKRESNK